MHRKPTNTIRLFFSLAILSLPCMPAAATSAQPAYLNINLPADQRAADLVGRMTVAERLSQLGTVAPAIPRLGVHAYGYENEAIHGVLTDSATLFPQVIGLSATWNDSLVQSIASAIADEARLFNLSHGRGLVYFAPMSNMARDPRWGRNQESYGEDPYLTAKFVTAFVRGLQGNDPHYLETVATAKHMACYNVEDGREGISSQVDEQSLRDYYLQPFKAAVLDGGVASIMAAYNAVNGIPCCCNVPLIWKILRQEWGFSGYVTSDAGAVGYVCQYHHFVNSYAEAAVAACRAGCDLCCVSTFQEYLPFALATGLGFLQTTDIDSAAKRILTGRFRLGEFDPPALVSYNSLQPGGAALSLRQQLALTAAHESIVLLKNDSLLPLDTGTIRTLAVIGPNAAVCQFGDYSAGPLFSVTPLQGIIGKLGADRVTFVQGCTMSGGATAAAFDSATAAARQADAVVMIMGTDQTVATEGYDMPALTLPGSQEQLIEAVYAANPRVILVLVNGNPLAVTWPQAHLPAIVDAWFGGQSQGTAIADVLFGDYNPGGKLTATWVADESDLPSKQDYVISHNRTYWYFDKTPLYPFGYGLSYTTFAIGPMTLGSATLAPGDTVMATVGVTNTGSRTGDEVVQFYVHDNFPGDPLKRLKGFKRVSLSPGEQTTVNFALPFSSLSYWNAGTQSYATRSGNYDLEIGVSSTQIVDSAPITVTGGVDAPGGPSAVARTTAGTGLCTCGIFLYAAGSWKATIIRPDGRCVWSISGFGPSTLPFHPPARGLYLLRLEEKNNPTQILKIVVER
jgi:beta-glucosidase